MKKTFKYFLVFLAGIMLLGVLVSVGTIKIPTVDTGTEETPTTPDVTYFPINTDFENVSLFSYTALKISSESETVSITVSADEGYSLPEEIIVTGCDYVWNAYSGSLLLANPTTNVFVTIVGVEGESTVTPTVETYSINVERSNVFNFASNVDKITDNGNYVTLKYEAYTGYELPDDIYVYGCNYIWNANLGELILMNPFDNVDVEIFATELCYNVYETLTGVSSSNSSSIPGMIMSGNVLFKYTAKSGYTLPKTVTVTGADYTWAPSTGILTLFNFTGNVSIKIIGVVNTPDPEPDPEPQTYIIKAGSWYCAGDGDQASTNATWREMLIDNGIDLPIRISTGNGYLSCADVSLTEFDGCMIYYIYFMSDGSMVFVLDEQEEVTAWDDEIDATSVYINVEHDFDVTEEEYYAWITLFEYKS